MGYRQLWAYSITGKTSGSYPEDDEFDSLWAYAIFLQMSGDKMLILGVILLVIGWLAGISILVTIGAIVAVIGLVLLLLSFAGSGPLSGRRYY